MRNFKYFYSTKYKKQSLNKTINKKYNSLTPLDLRDIYANNFSNKENIRLINNNITLTVLKESNNSIRKPFQIINSQFTKSNNNKLKREYQKKTNNNKKSKIKSNTSFNKTKLYNNNNTKFNSSLKNYIYNKPIKNKNIKIISNLKKNNLSNINNENTIKSKNEIFSQTTYNIYNLNTPIYNLINFPTITNNKRYFSPRLSDDSSYFSNKNKIKLKKHNTKSLIGSSNFENEKNETINDSLPFSTNRIYRCNKNGYKKYIYTNIYNNKINFFKSPLDHSKIINSKKGNNNISKTNNNNSKTMKQKSTGLKKYLTLALHNNSKSKNLNKKNKTNLLSKEKSKSILNKLSSSNSITIKKSLKNTIIEKPRIITKKIMKINSCTLAGQSSPGVQKLNQDKFFIKKDFLDEPEQFFIGVCDGHGMHGHYISEYVSKYLPEKLINISNDEYIKSSFIDMQKSLISDNIKIDSSLSGTTCTSLIISLEKIICINLGDSRAILARYENGAYNVINLSRDHKLTEPDEMKRILKNNGIIKQYYDKKTNQYIGPERVYLNNSEIPGLSMSRSIGDSIAHNIGVISEPEIFKFNYTGNEKFIIIATDGIWEFIDSEECATIIKEYYENNMDAVGGLNALVKEAFKRWKNEEDNVDDITAIVIFFE